MAQDFFTSSHHSIATIRTAVTPPVAASPPVDAQQGKAANASQGRPSAEEANQVQVLNFHPVLGQVRSFSRKGSTPSITPQSFEEQYWMLPGAIFTDV